MQKLGFISGGGGAEGWREIMEDVEEWGPAAYIETAGNDDDVVVE